MLLSFSSSYYFLW